MVLRKITIDNSVRYISKSEQTKEIKRNTLINGQQSEQIQPISRRGKLNTRKQNKNYSKNKKFIEDFVAGGFGILK